MKKLITFLVFGGLLFAVPKNAEAFIGTGASTLNQQLASIIFSDKIDSKQKMATIFSSIMNNIWDTNRYYGQELNYQYPNLYGNSISTQTPNVDPEKMIAVTMAEKILFPDSGTSKIQNPNQIPPSDGSSTKAAGFVKDPASTAKNFEVKTHIIPAYPIKGDPVFMQVEIFTLPYSECLPVHGIINVDGKAVKVQQLQSNSPNLLHFGTDKIQIEQAAAWGLNQRHFVKVIAKNGEKLIGRLEFQVDEFASLRTDSNVKNEGSYQQLCQDGDGRDCIGQIVANAEKLKLNNLQGYSLPVVTGKIVEMKDGENGRVILIIEDSVGNRIPIIANHRAMEMYKVGDEVSAKGKVEIKDGKPQIDAEMVTRPGEIFKEVNKKGDVLPANSKSREDLATQFEKASAEMEKKAAKAVQEMGSGAASSGAPTSVKQAVGNAVGVDFSKLKEQNKQVRNENKSELLSMLKSSDESQKVGIETASNAFLAAIGGFITGGITGAMAGMAVGPIGVIAGGLVGGVVGAAGASVTTTIIDTGFNIVLSKILPDFSRVSVASITNHISENPGQSALALLVGLGGGIFAGLTKAAKITKSIGVGVKEYRKGYSKFAKSKNSMGEAIEEDEAVIENTIKKSAKTEEEILKTWEDFIGAEKAKKLSNIPINVHEQTVKIPIDSSIFKDVERFSASVGGKIQVIGNEIQANPETAAIILTWLASLDGHFSDERINYYKSMYRKIANQGDDSNDK